jgi:hypothetical protein
MDQVMRDKKQQMWWIWNCSRTNTDGNFFKQDTLKIKSKSPYFTSQNNIKMCSQCIQISINTDRMTLEEFEIYNSANQIIKLQSEKPQINYYIYNSLVRCVRSQISKLKLKFCIKSNILWISFICILAHSKWKGESCSQFWLGIEMKKGLKFKPEL